MFTRKSKFALSLISAITALSFAGGANAQTTTPAPADTTNASAPEGVPPPTMDTNEDGKPDAWDRDGDSKPDAWDTDGDSKPDALDNDRDGKPDAKSAKDKPSAKPDR